MLALVLVMLPAPVLAQTAEPAQGEVPTLTLENALRVALTRNYQLNTAELDVESAEAQIREAWAQPYPQVDLTSSYTRNVVTANPFAGSDISSFFGGGGQADWVAFNERARTDDDPSTNPIPFDEFRERQQEAVDAAGIDFGGGGNPFGVDNIFRAGISVEQTLFNGSAFAAISGAQQLRELNLRAVDRRQQVLIRDVRQAFYQALLAQQRVQVARQSVERTQETLREVIRKVARGTVAKYQQLSAEVELANLRTQLVEAQNQAGLAADELKFVLGLPVDQPITLAGSLDAERRGRYLTVSAEEAMAAALENRPDLERARLAVELREIDKNITQAQYLPRLSAFANFNYSGRVPDDRTRILTDPTDPFFYETNTLDFFADEYWNPSVSVGLQLTWNLFDGFQRAAQVEQREVAVRQAEIAYQRLRQQVQLQVQSALRSLEAARERIQAQTRNVERAETNYRFTNQRVEAGVSTQLELREASEQLDTARLNYLQAVYDFKAARAAFETAIGRPLAGPDAIEFTGR